MRGGRAGCSAARGASRWRSGSAGSLQRPFVRGGRIRRLPGPLAAGRARRDLKPIAPQTFRDWWKRGGERARRDPRPRPRRAGRRPAGAARSRATTAGRQRSTPAARVALFCERVGDYRADVRARRRPRRRGDRGRRAADGPPAASCPPACPRRGVRRRLELVDGQRPRRRTSSTRSTASSPAARSRSPRPGRSCSTAGAARGPPRAHARPRPARLRRRGEPDRRARPRGDRAPRRRSCASERPLTLISGPVGHLRHRAQPRRGRARAAHARRARSAARARRETSPIRRSASRRLASEFA